MRGQPISAPTPNTPPPSQGTSAFSPDGPLRAFPSSAIDGRFGGMSLRDYFAGKALGHLTGNDDTVARASWTERPEADLARWAYRIADAMLAAREQDDYPTHADLIEALETLHCDARPDNWSDEDQPGEPGFEAAMAWRKLDSVLAAAKGGAA